MAMWDRIKDQAKGLQQQAQGARGGSGSSSGSSTGHGRPGAGPLGAMGSGGSSGSGRSGGGSKAQLVSALKSQLTSLKTELKSGAYRDASMAICALVAAADGHVDRPSSSMWSR